MKDHGVVRGRLESYSVTADVWTGVTSSCCDYSCRGLRLNLDIDCIEPVLGTCYHHLCQIAISTHEWQKRLGLWISKPDVVFQGLWPRGGNHKTSEEDADEGKACGLSAWATSHMATDPQPSLLIPSTVGCSIVRCTSSINCLDATLVGA